MAAPHPLQGRQSCLSSMIIGATTITTSSASLMPTTCPQQGYLREMLRPFADPAVGYVSAPSICGNNAQESWAARTRLYTEAAFHGVLQSGYNAGLGTDVHRIALRGAHQGACGRWAGLGPELAEDHSTTLLDECGRLARRACDRRHCLGRWSGQRGRSGHAGIPMVAQSGHPAAALYAALSCNACHGGCGCNSCSAKCSIRSSV